MANDKSNINELVTDDEDPTAELEALTAQQFSSGDRDSLLESGARTHSYDSVADGNHETTINELKSDLESRSETINRLQFDIEQFRAKWNGLEAEIKARQEITDGLNRKLDSAREKLERKEKLLRKRDQSIKALKAEIRQRNEDHGRLQGEISKLENELDALRHVLEADRGNEALQDKRLIERQAGQLASKETEIRELRAHIDRNESYADSLRRQLQERTETSREIAKNRKFLESSLADATQRISELEASLETMDTARAELEEQLESLHSTHAEEIRMIRFELGEAQETVAQQNLVAEQLASDLVDTRGYRAELEKMLTETEETSQTKIEQLEKENRKLRSELQDNEEKLAAKSEAINCLLTELARKTQQIESIVEIEDVIQEIDGRMSDRIKDRHGADKDRVTRLLIGAVEGQELRFPLFKDRLTIGRTDQNDIQLKASYVSRRHAVVVTDREMTRVIDWGSKNGVFVNGNRVTEHFLKNGDTVTIGTADFRYEERPKRDA